MSLGAVDAHRPAWLYARLKMFHVSPISIFFSKGCFLPACMQPATRDGTLPLPRQAQPPLQVPLPQTPAPLPQPSLPPAAVRMPAILLDISNGNTHVSFTLHCCICLPCPPREIKSSSKGICIRVFMRHPGLSRSFKLARQPELPDAQREADPPAQLRLQ